MRQEVLFARRSGVDIVVLGILRPDRTVDVERTSQLVELAYPMQVTFHKAFDVTRISMRRCRQSCVREFPGCLRQAHVLLRRPEHQWLANCSRL